MRRSSSFPVLAPILGALLLLAAAPPAAASAYRVIAVQETDLGGDLVRTDTTVEVDGEPVNRFLVHRLRKVQQPPRGSLLLLPPLANPFAFFEADERGSYDRSFAAFFAHRGWEVWGYTPRGFQLAPGDCESGAVDCSPMAGWGLGAIVRDATWIRGRMALAVPGAEPVVAGYSLGGLAATALIDAHPDDWRAVALLEASLYSERPQVRALNARWCTVFEGLLAAGSYFDGQTSALIRLIAHLAETAPQQPTPLPGFPPGTTNHQVLVFLLAVHQDAPDSPTPWFLRCVGSVEDDRLDHCDEDRLFAHLPLFLPYVDHRTFRDINCSLAGERTFTDDLGDFTGEVLLLGVELGFGPLNAEQAPLFTGAEVSEELIPGFGHADLWFTVDHRRHVETELLRWLNGLP